jgi:hypothetical protein
VRWGLAAVGMHGNCARWAPPVIPSPHPSSPLPGAERSRLHGDGSLLSCLCWGVLQRLPNHLHDTLGIFEHVIVPESDDAVTVAQQLDTMQVIIFRVGMLTTVELNHEPSRRASEIGDAPTDGMLATELPRKAALPERVPEAPLGIGRIAAKLARDDRPPARRQGPTSPCLSAPAGRRGTADSELSAHRPLNSSTASPSRACARCGRGCGARG